MTPFIRTGGCLAAWVAVAALVAHSSPVRAGGFLIYDLSAEAIGKASAVSASTSEPAAVWFNPAALAYQEHGVSLSGVAVLARSRFEPLGGGPEVESEPGRFLLPTFFGTVRLHDRLALGFGFFPAFGLTIAWPEDWLGRESTIKASIETVNFNPTAAVKLLPELSLAAGLQVIRGAVELKNALPAVVGGTATIGAGTWGLGANAALLYRPLPDRFHLALAYRSRAELSFDGRVDFDPHPDFAPSLPDQRGGAGITIPDIFTLGVMWRPAPNLTLTFDPNLVLWSTFDRVVIDFETAPDRILERNSRNTVTLRLGVDWATPAPGLSARAGLIFDQNASPAATLAPSLPDGNRLDFALGLGYRWQWLKADVGYLFVYFLPSKATTGREGPEGTYRTLAQVFGVTVSALFGR
jgi:long-chain fatty acid transport protein